MFATTRMALLIGGAIGGATFPLFAQETTKNDTVIVTSPVQSGATKLATPDIETPQSLPASSLKSRAQPACVRRSATPQAYTVIR